MKGKKLTRDMKIFLEREGLNPTEWLYQKNTDQYLQLCQKSDSKKTKIIQKEK